MKLNNTIPALATALVIASAPTQSEAVHHAHTQQRNDLMNMLAEIDEDIISERLGGCNTHSAPFNDGSNFANAYGGGGGGGVGFRMKI